MLVEIVVFLTIAGFGLYAAVEGYSIDGQSGDFPLILGIALLTLGAIGVIHGFYRYRGSCEAASKGLWIPILGLVVFLGYLLLSGIIGPIPGAVPFMLVLALCVARDTRWKMVLTSTLGFSVFVYLVFDKLLNIPLPSSSLLG